MKYNKLLNEVNEKEILKIAPIHYVELFKYLINKDITHVNNPSMSKMEIDEFLTSFEVTNESKKGFDAEILFEIFFSITHKKSLSRLFSRAIVEIPKTLNKVLCFRSTVEMFHFHQQVRCLKIIIDKIPDIDNTQSSLKDHLCLYIKQASIYASPPPEHYFWAAVLKSDQNLLNEWLSIITAHLHKPDGLNRPIINLLLACENHIGHQIIKTILNDNKNNKVLLNNFIAGLGACDKKGALFYFDICQSLRLFEVPKYQTAILANFGMSAKNTGEAIKILEIIHKNLLTQNACDDFLVKARFLEDYELYGLLICLGMKDLDLLCEEICSSVNIFDTEQIEIMMIYLFNTGMFILFNKVCRSVLVQLIANQDLNLKQIKLFALMNNLKLADPYMLNILEEEGDLFWQVSEYIKKMEEYLSIANIDTDFTNTWDFFELTYTLENRYGLLLALSDESPEKLKYLLNQYSHLCKGVKNKLIHSRFKPCSLYSYTSEVDETKTISGGEINFSLLLNCLNDKDIGIAIKAVNLLRRCSDELPITIIETLFMQFKRNNKALNPSLLALFKCLSIKQICNLILRHSKTKHLLLQASMVEILCLHQSAQKESLLIECYDVVISMNKLSDVDRNRLEKWYVNLNVL
ncbi:hypothetical protein [Thorsellia anophelis]|uniref:Uncharacterized protein n=1 Tax=Thorsellia anophelis DSM 18579 TaxID=1123402 RepID=A0A1I0BI92_9GAMM|nr:hypothetical protein [Thorsellia anophelis]SET06277.1 hypothetical protein SAMN02583745_01256 [Thorsellia anophelis DSM 18579]